MFFLSPSNSVCGLYYSFTPTFCIIIIVLYSTRYCYIIFVGTVEPQSYGNCSVNRTLKLNGYLVSTVEFLLTDTPRKGHCIKYLSTMDKTKSPNFIPHMNIMRLEPLKEDNLYTGDKPLEFILVPKCPLFRDSTVSSKFL